MPASLQFRVSKGEDVTFTGTHYADSTQAAVVNITGWTIQLTIKDADGNPASFSPKTGTVVLGSAGTYSWSMVSADTISLDAQSLDIDVFRIDSGSKRLMGKGQLYIDPDVRYGG